MTIYKYNSDKELIKIKSMLHDRFGSKGLNSAIKNNEWWTS